MSTPTLRQDNNPQRDVGKTAYADIGNIHTKEMVARDAMINRYQANCTASGDVNDDIGFARAASAGEDGGTQPRGFDNNRTGRAGKEQTLMLSTLAEDVGSVGSVDSKRSLFNNEDVVNSRAMTTKDYQYGAPASVGVPTGDGAPSSDKKADRPNVMNVASAGVYHAHMVVVDVVGVDTNGGDCADPSKKGVGISNAAMTDGVLILTPDKGSTHTSVPVESWDAAAGPDFQSLGMGGGLAASAVQVCTCACSLALVFWYLPVSGCE